jgi:hypothetical protein
VRVRCGVDRRRPRVTHRACRHPRWTECRGGRGRRDRSRRLDR